jgi:DNA polymerase V
MVAYEDIHVYSIDEAFIDMTSYLPYYEVTPVEFVEMLIKKINDETGLTATGGIGDNFFLAKVALDVFAKHEKNGIAVLRQNEIKERMWPITPLTKIWGIGPRLEIRLNKLGIFTLGDLATSDKEFIVSKFGIMGEQMYNHANGIDEADVHEVYIPKEHSLDIGQVLPRDFNAIETKTIMREMIDDLSFRMREEGKLTNRVSLYIGYSIEGGFARQMTLLTPTDDASKLLEACLEIYDKYMDVTRAVRRVGIGFGKLKDDDYRQLNLFEDNEDQIKVQDMQKAIDILHKKFGKNSILRASALMEGSTAIERHNQIGGHRK